MFSYTSYVSFYSDVKKPRVRTHDMHVSTAIVQKENTSHWNCDRSIDTGLPGRSIEKGTSIDICRRKIPVDRKIYPAKVLC